MKSNWKNFIRKVVVALLPNSALLSTRYSTGAIVRGENRAGHGGRGLFIFGEELEPELKLLKHFVMPGDLFVDVGANVGAYTIMAASLVGASGTVLALEPFPRMADMLLCNVISNQFNNVRLRVCCAADQDGHARFWMKNSTPNSFSLVESPGSACFDSLTVSLDSILSREALGAPAFIKIDAEGAENSILNGAARTIRDAHPTILIERTIETNPTLFEGYEAFALAESPNILLIHQDSPDKVTALKNGFSLLLG